MSGLVLKMTATAKSDKSDHLREGAILSNVNCHALSTFSFLSTIFSTSAMLLYARTSLYLIMCKL